MLDFSGMTIESQRTAVKTYAQTLVNRFSSFHQLLDDLYCWRHLDAYRLRSLVWMRGDNRDGGAGRGPVILNFKDMTIYAVEIAATVDTLASFFAAERPNFQILPISDDIPDNTLANYSERVARGHWETIDKHRGASYQAECAELIAWSGHLIDKARWLSPEERGEEREQAAPIPTAQPDNTFAAITQAGGPANDLETQTDTILVDPGRYPVVKELVDPRYAAWELGPDANPDVFVHEYDVPWSLIRATYTDIHERPEFTSYQGEGSASLVKVTDFYTRTHHAILINYQFYKDPTPHNHPGGMPVVIELMSPFDYKGADGAFIRVGRPFCMHMMESCRQLSWILSAEATYMQRTLGMPMKHMGLRRNSMYLQEPSDPNGPMIYRPVVNRSPDQNFFPLEEGEDIVPIEPPPVSIATQQFAERMSQSMSMLGFSPGILSGQAPAGTSGYGAYQITLATRARMEPPRVSLERFAGRSVDRDFAMMAYYWDIDNNTFALAKLAKQAGRAQPQVISYADVVNVGSVEVSINPRIRVASEQEITLMLQAHAQGLMSDYVLINLLSYADDPDMEQKRIAFERYAKSDPNYMAALAKSYAEENNLPIPQSVQQIAEQQVQQQAQAMMMQQQQGGQPGQPGPQQPTPSLPSSTPTGAPAQGAGPGGGAAAVLQALQARQGQ